MAIENGLIPKELVTLLNYRINQEETSSRLYYAMHEWLDNKGYFGAAKMIKRWSEEEMYHAGWARKFLEAYGYLPEVGGLSEPKVEFSTLKDVMKRSLEHEIEITEQCNDLAQILGAKIGVITDGIVAIWINPNHPNENAGHRHVQTMGVRLIKPELGQVDSV